MIFINSASINVYWYEKPWEPIEVTIGFKPVSGDWGTYAVYAWGEEEVYGAWPGTTLEPNQDGWYSFVVPTSRPVNLILNNKDGKQFDFLKDPTVSACYEFEIGDDNNNCVWTDVDCPDLSPDPALYIIGEEFGAWDWTSEGVVTMTPVHSTPGHFWAIRYITAGKGFKWCAVRDWNGDFNSLGEDIGFYVQDGNAFVEESGLYMIYVDTENGKISVETAKVYGMGDCFGSWDVATYPFTIDGTTMSITTAASAELRMYAASDISPVGGDWWKMEFIFLADGKIIYRGAGDDQERITVDAGKKVTLDFNAGTGTIE